MGGPRALMRGLAIGESPRWHDGRLWFCNWGAHEVIAVDPEGSSEVVLRDPEVRPHSIEWLPDGRMLVVPGSEGHRGLLLRREPDGRLVTHADLRGVAEYGLNEIVVDGRGNVYVNDMGFDFMAFLRGEARFAPGGVLLVTPDGSARRVASGIEFPNGMVVSADNRTLIVAESFPARLTAFDVAEDGSLSNRRVWAELGEGGDGISLDAEGAVWTPVGGRGEQQPPAVARVAEGGAVLQRIELDQSCFACMLGGPDRRTLFVMAAEWHPEDPFGGPRTGQVLAVQAPAAGVGWP